jgi:hypothetical protein
MFLGLLLAAQAGIVRGTVLADSATPLPYAVVELTPGRRLFTDSHGAFVFTGVAPGSYRLAARQVGFTPAETTLTVAQNPERRRLVLRHLPVELTGIAVEAEAVCRSPGAAPAAADTGLATVFEQLFENAARFQLLADEYPFTYWMERWASDFDARGRSIWEGHDTLAIRSEQRLRYLPGTVLRPGLAPGGRPARVVGVPQLPDLADSAFRARHCFRYGGMTELDGAPMVLVEFRAGERLPSLDVDGCVWLDAATFAVRRIVVRIAPAPIADLQSVEVTADFREVAPWVLVPRRIETVTVLASRGIPVRRQVEVQRLLRTHFARPLDAVPP